MGGVISVKNTFYKNRKDTKENYPMLMYNINYIKSKNSSLVKPASLIIANNVPLDISG